MVIGVDLTYDIWCGKTYHHTSMRGLLNLNEKRYAVGLNVIYPFTSYVTEPALTFGAYSHDLVFALDVFLVVEVDFIVELRRMG